MSDVQVTVTIPEGYTAEPKMRPLVLGEIGLAHNGEIVTWKWNFPSQTKHVVLHPIAPAYVMVKVLRTDAETYRRWCRIHSWNTDHCEVKGFENCRIAAAMREALEAKGEPVCGEHHHNGETCPSKHCGGGRSLPCQLPVNHEGPHT